MDAPGVPPREPAPEPLQFDKAEFQEAPAGRTCAGCGQKIQLEYFAAGGSVLCPACAKQLSSPSGGKLAGLRAFGYGLGAALVGTVIWSLIIKITEAEWGIVAIAVGLLVGFGVRKGSRGRGGWKYQAMAMALTYFSITASNVPFVIEALAKGPPPPAAATTAAEDPARPKPAEAVPAGGTQAAPATAASAPTIPGALAAVLLIVFIFGLALAGPFLAGASNIMGIIIIGIALYEAWKLNKRVTVTGPFQLASEPAAEPAAAAAPVEAPPP